MQSSGGKTILYICCPSNRGNHSKKVNLSSETPSASTQPTSESSNILTESVPLTDAQNELFLQMQNPIQHTPLNQSLFPSQSYFFLFVFDDFCSDQLQGEELQNMLESNVVKCPGSLKFTKVGGVFRLKERVPCMPGTC